MIAIQRIVSQRGAIMPAVRYANRQSNHSPFPPGSKL
jgi:hypothetical protein